MKPRISLAPPAWKRNDSLRPVVSCNSACRQRLCRSAGWKYARAWTVVVSSPDCAASVSTRHLRAALLRDQLFDIADLHAGERRERVGRGGLRSGRARDDAGAVAVLSVFDARRQRHEVGELV